MSLTAKPSHLFVLEVLTSKVMTCAVHVDSAVYCTYLFCGLQAKADIVRGIPLQSAIIAYTLLSIVETTYLSIC